MFEVISPGKQHTCDKPGWCKRWKLGLVEGALISCLECKRVYRLEHGRWTETLASFLLRNKGYG